MMHKLDIEIKNGWIEHVRRVISPNYDDRPDDSKLEIIVIHGISLPPGDFGGNGIDQLFTNQINEYDHPYYKKISNIKVSSHVLINREGSITQYVSFLKRAWHAGESSHLGKGSCNDYSIGIELEGTDDNPYEDKQYLCLAKLIKSLKKNYASLNDGDIVGHCDIAPGRKTDPGKSFDWRYLSSLL